MNQLSLEVTEKYLKKDLRTKNVIQIGLILFVTALET